MNGHEVQTLRLQVGRVAEGLDLDLVVLFGSLATGKGRADSDADVAVRAATHLSLDLHLDIAARLSEVFRRVVDVVDIRRADPLLLHQIFRQPIVLHDRAPAFAETRLLAFHRYEDYRPMLALERRAVRRALGMDGGRS